MRQALRTAHDQVYSHSMGRYSAPLHREWTELNAEVALVLVVGWLLRRIDGWLGLALQTRPTADGGDRPPIAM